MGGDSYNESPQVRLPDMTEKRAGCAASRIQGPLGYDVIVVTGKKPCIYKRSAFFRFAESTRSTLIDCHLLPYGHRKPRRNKASSEFLKFEFLPPRWLRREGHCEGPPCLRGVFLSSEETVG